MNNAETYLKQGQFYTDEVDYLMLSLPLGGLIAAAGVLAEVAQPFGTLILDKDEVTVIIAVEDYEAYQKRLPGARLSEKKRLITLDVVLPPDLIGLMALITKLLADAGIPIIALGAFDRDHLLVPAERFKEAWQILKEQQSA